MEYLRIWQECDFTRIENTIVIVDDLFGYCPGCKEIGISLNNLKKCPNCDRNFEYITSREAKGDRDGLDVIMRIRKKIPHLTFIDYEDYLRVMATKKGESLFKDE